MAAEAWSDSGFWLGEDMTILCHIYKEDPEQEPILRVGNFTVTVDLNAEDIDLKAMSETIEKLRLATNQFCDGVSRMITIKLDKREEVDGSDGR